MKENAQDLISDVRLYGRALGRFFYTRIYKIFSGFEVIKRFLARILYRQRGRFVRPFVHTAMGGVIAMALALAPVLANTFPTSRENVVVEATPERSVMEMVENPMSTEVSSKLRDQVEEYQVQEGDTMSGIANKFGISVDTIRWENNLASVNSIKPGQTLRILPVTGVKHVVGRGETIYTISKKYGANSQAVVDFPFNTFVDNETFALAVGQDLIVPDGEKPNEITVPNPNRYLAQRTPDAGAVTGTGRFAWPLSGRLTQGFSLYHRGIDIATAMGMPIKAADAGTVVVAGWPDNSGYGMRVILDHGNGYQTWYAHLSKTSVVVGQRVNRGDVIGLEGSTGRSTGPHLHFEIRLNGAHQSPMTHLK